MTNPTDDSDGKSDVAKDEASNVASTVKEQASAAGDQIQESGQQVVGVAKEQVAQLSSEARRQLHSLFEQTQQEFSARATEQADRVATNLRGVADELRALAEGRAEDASRVVPYAHQAADHVGHYADRLRNGGVSGVANDLSEFARRRPGAFLLGAVVAGFAAGRLVRGVQRGSGAEDVPTTEGSQISVTGSRPPQSIVPPLDGVEAGAMYPTGGGQGAA